MKKASHLTKYNGLDRGFKKIIILFGVVLVVLFMCLVFNGCRGADSYSTESLFPDEVVSVYVEMFENESFERGVEYTLSQAVGKRIEADTPYKIITDRNRADTVLSGKLVSVGEGVLTTERETGRPLERDIQLRAVVNWKNLKTGELLLDNMSVSSLASYSEWQNQGFEYGSLLAANKLSEKIVELMENEW